MQFRIDIFHIILSFYSLILISIFSMISENQVLILINSCSFIILLFYFLIFYKSDKYLKILLIFFLLISLGTLCTSWDARSIWLFKTKIFFYETNIFDINNHPQFSHPTYPILGPLFASIFVRSVNFWNEIFPKIGIFFLFIPPLLSLSIFFKNNYLYALFSILLFVVGKYFFNGEMDGLISIYFLNSIILSYNVIFNNGTKNTQLFNILIFNNIILSLLKFEGTVLIILIFLLFLFHFFITKKIKLDKLIWIIISIIPSILWFIYSNHINIVYNLNDSSFSFTNFINRIDNFKDLLLIIKFIMSDEKFLMSLFIFFFIYFKSKERNLFNMVFIINSMYLAILIALYLSTNYDLQWHLSSSINRVIKPITLSFIVITLYCYYLNKLRVK